MERKIYDLTRQDPLRSNNEWQNVNKGCGSEETPVMEWSEELNVLLLL